MLPGYLLRCRYGPSALLSWSRTRGAHLKAGVAAPLRAAARKFVEGTPPWTGGESCKPGRHSVRLASDSDPDELPADVPLISFAFLSWDST